jgi:GNAT superfamily N-acetyltransferase
VFRRRARERTNRQFRSCGGGFGQSVPVPQSKLRFVALTEADAQMVTSWFANDPDGQREFGGFYGVHPKWWDLLQTEPGRHGWTVWRESEPIGFVDLEVAEGVGQVAFYVAPTRRGQGLGTTILKALGRVARPLGADVLSGGVRPENVASVKASLASGGHQVGKNEYGEFVIRGSLEPGDDAS